MKITLEDIVGRTGEDSTGRTVLKLRDYPNMVVVDYTIYNNGDRVTIGIIGYSEKDICYNNKAHECGMVTESVDPEEIISEVSRLELQLGPSAIPVIAGKNLIQEMFAARRLRYPPQNK